MKNKLLLLLATLPMCLNGQSLSSLSAAWIEMEKLPSEQLAIRVFTEYPNLNEPLPDSLELKTFHWSDSLQEWLALTNSTSLRLAKVEQFQVEQNTYYPNCAPWIGAQTCIPISVGRYAGILNVPVTLNQARIRLTFSRADVLEVQNATSGSDGLTAFCYTDFSYQRANSSNLHSPKLVPTETWHRYFPIHWPMRPVGGNFINSYLPFEYSTSSQRGVAKAPLFTGFNSSNNSFTTAENYQAEDSAIHFFALLSNPLQLGITNLQYTDGRFANPLRIWNKTSVVDSNLTYIYLVGNLRDPLLSSIREEANWGEITSIRLYDLLGRLRYEGPSLANFQGPRDELYLITEIYPNGRLRHRKIKISH